MPSSTSAITIVVESQAAVPSDSGWSVGIVHTWTSTFTRVSA
jgi:hypothetical protein